jgi:hypothetical protein
VRATGKRIKAGKQVVLALLMFADRAALRVGVVLTQARSRLSLALGSGAATTKLGGVLPLAGHFPSFQYVHDITNLPKPLGHLFCHRRGSSQRLLYANKIVAHRKQGHASGSGRTSLDDANTTVCNWPSRQLVRCSDMSEVG